MSASDDPPKALLVTWLAGVLAGAMGGAEQPKPEPKPKGDLR
jgi:hypothetical protein